MLKQQSRSILSTTLVNICVKCHEFCLWHLFIRDDGVIRFSRNTRCTLFQSTCHISNLFSDNVDAINVDNVAAKGAARIVQQESLTRIISKKLLINPWPMKIEGASLGFIRVCWKAPINVRDFLAGQLSLSLAHTAVWVMRTFLWIQREMLLLSRNGETSSCLSGKFLPLLLKQDCVWLLLFCALTSYCQLNNLCKSS